MAGAQGRPKNGPSGSNISKDRRTGLKSSTHSNGLPFRSTLLSLCVFLCVLVSPCNSIRFLGEPETYAKYPKWDACINASITFEFRTTQKDGLLMYTDDNGRYDYLQVALNNGAVRLWINFVREEEQAVEIALGVNLNDGKWHTVEVRRNRMETTLLVDSNQSSQVAFGSDFSFGEELETNNYMYFGGIPTSSYQHALARQVLPANVLDTPFVGEIRNILYFNCSCVPVRATMLEARGFSDFPRETCELRNPCPKDCPCISGDDAPGCVCKYRQECIKDLLAHYQLPMDSIDRDLIFNPSGLDSRVYGRPELVRGVHEMALKIDGRSQWLRVSGPSHKQECFGDLSHCPTGYFVGMWVKFEGYPDQKSIYMSNGGHISDGHGIAMSYSMDGLEFDFKTKDGKLWTVTERDVLPGRWYHIAASWDKDKGLYLYINGIQAAHDQSPRRTTESRGAGTYEDFIIGRPNDRSATNYLKPVLVDDFSFMSTFKSETDMREEGPAFMYHLPMDSVRGSEIDVKGFEATAFGPLQAVPGKIKQGFSFSGRGEYIDLGDASEKCLGDLEACKHGFYTSFFIRFNRLENSEGYILSTPYGMNIYQMGSQLVANAQRGRSTWEARYTALSPGIWYFVEVSWSKDGGLSLYVDGNEVARQIRESFIREPRSAREMKAFIGRSNDGARREGLNNAIVDNMDVYYGTRDMLSAIDYISTERPKSHHFDFEDIRGDRVVDDTMVIVLQGSPEQTEGKVGQGLKLDGTSEVVDFGDHSSECFGNLDLCHHGALYSMWLRPDRLRNNMYFMTSGGNGVGLRYRGGNLYATADTSAKKWETTTSNLEDSKWYFVELSFHPVRGLGLYVNNELVAEDTSPEERSSRERRSVESDRVYLGRGNENMRDARYAEATYDEMEMWHADREYLSAHGHIQRSRPRSFIIEFEELIGEERLRHPVLSIRLVGRPVLIPGKVNNALELSGRGQYADLGQRGGECFSNLAECTQGITIAAWMRFHRFENNMVFLSTGENGILMMYKDGYIQVSADGRGVITTQRFESGRWYFVEITWHPDTGLKLYVDNELRGQSAADYVTRGGSDRGSFYIGRPNQGDVQSGRYSTGNFDVDEMEIWYDKRENLLAFGYINRDNLGYEAFSLDTADGSTIAHTKYIILLVDGATIVPGRFGNAVELSGMGQYVDLGTHYSRCFGNLDLCSHGLTLSLWLNPQDLRDGTTFFATPTYRVFYENGRLNSIFRGQERSWTTTTTRLRPEEWQRLTMAWHPKKGLTMYINDELVDQDRRGNDEPQRDQPVSEHIYLGRGLTGGRYPANFMADELQVWYDDLDQLRATGQYRVQVVPTSILFNDWRDNRLRIRDREIQGYGDIQLIQGKGVDTRAIYLRGTTGYLDLGANFTCGGDLETCRQGATIRFGLRPTTLRDGMVFLDSFPVKLYYRDGRLYGQLQTSTQVWTVDTQDFRPGQWQRVELTWHPRDGLVMFIDGRRVDSQTYPREQTSRVPADWRTYFGRALQGGQTYADTVVDSIEFWTAYRDYLPEDGYLRIEEFIPPTPRPNTPRPTVIITPRPGQFGQVTTQYPLTRFPPDPPQTRKIKTINLNGLSFVQFDFRNLPREYLQPAEIEEVQFYFLTNYPDGLIWYHDEPGRKMYLYIKDGHLVFVNDDGSGSPDEVHIGRREGVRFDDGAWHLFRISRRGRRITLSVNGRHREDYIFSRNVQFLVPTEVYLGGTQNTYASTGGRVVPNFHGGLALILYKTETRQGNRLFRNEVNLIAEIGEDFSRPGINFTVIDWPAVTSRPTRYPPTRPPTPRPTTPAPPTLTSVTIKDESTYITVQDPLQLQHGSSLSFKFSTIKRDALLLYSTSNIYGKNFIALEIYDGKLYLIHNFGGQSKRTLFSEREVSDGQQHEVELRFFNEQIAMTLDGQAQRVRVEPGEELPRNLGSLYLGGFSAYELLPWHTWARRGYQGCLEDLRINGRTIDLHRYVQAQQLYGRVDRRCTAMPQQCSLLSPCVNGYCTNQWGGYMCDCRATDYTGERCEQNAWTGVFNGTEYYKMVIRPQQKYHVDNISFRFKTMVTDGLIFQTRARDDGGFMRAELDSGRVKITTNLGGEFQTIYLGEDLNDMQWHTVYIQRRGNQLEAWVDDLDHEKKILPGAGYFLLVDDVFVGGSNPGELTLPDSDKHYIGYLRNFFIGGFDIFEEIGASGGGTFFREPNIPPLVFYDVTFPDFNANVQLPPLGLATDLSLHFWFKTHDPNGVIFFNEGRNKELFAVELFDGRLHVKLDIPGKAPVNIGTPESSRFDNGEWHYVSITADKVAGQEQLNVAVDKLRSTYSYSGIENINLSGPLYIGGLTQEMFQKQYIREFLSSKTGYRGCLASLDLGRNTPNLYQYGQNQGVTLYDSCQEIKTKCTPTTCLNGGICHDHLSNSTTWCDCSKTAFGGPRCQDEPLGYYFRNQGRTDLYGMLRYTYPNLERNDNAMDEIVFGVMTDEKNAVLTKLISGIFDDFVQISLVDGYPVVTYDTDGQGAITTIRSDTYVSDGNYHVIRFLRTKDKGSLFVDSGAASISTHTTSHGVFDRLGKIFIGGVDQGGEIVEGTGYRGIIGGMYVNGKMIFPDVKINKNSEIIYDVVEAPHPFRLGPMQTPPTPDWKTPAPTTPKPIVTPKPTPPVIPPFLPPGIGGGGVAWSGAAGGGTGGGAGGGAVDIVVFPGGSGGTAGGVPGGLPPVEGGPAAAPLVSMVPSLPASGPRAGAVMGTILGLAALASSLMWAFYRCKPGWCTCVKAPSAVPLNISSPRAGSNMAAVQAASAGAGVGGAGAGAGGAGAGAGGAGAGADVVDAAVVAGGVKGGVINGGGAGAGGGSSSSYYFSQQTASSGHQRQDSYDSATLRATGTFSNRGTAIGTPRAGRHQFASTSASAYSESNAIGSPASLQSYHFEGGHGDYDVASGVHSNYQSNTLSAGGGGAGAGAGGGFSTSTMSSNYNYSVKTIRTVGGQQQMMGYAAGSNNVIVTPGAMGEEIRVDCCLMTGDGHSVVTGSSLGPPQVWNMTNGELLRIMQGETVGSTDLHLVCNDRLLVGAINADLEVNQYSVPKGVHNYVFQIWDFASGRPLGMAELETCSALTVMSDNDKVVFGRSDKFGGGTNIVVWDLLGNQALKEMRYDAPVGNNDYISYISLSQNDRYVVAGFTNTFDNFAEFVIFDMTLTSYSISDPNILRLDADPECTAILPRDEAVTGLRNGDLVVWSLRTGQPSRQLLANNGKHAHSREVKAVARSEDNKYLVSASTDGTLKLWDLESERHMCTMSGHNDEVWCAAISSDNEIVVSGSRDGTIRLWQLRTGKEICSFNAGVDVFYITMSHDKGTIVALGDKFGARKLIMLQVVRSKVKRQVLA